MCQVCCSTRRTIVVFRVIYSLKVFPRVLYRLADDCRIALIRGAPYRINSREVKEYGSDGASDRDDMFHTHIDR